jgi:hypothetical protein
MAQNCTIIQADPWSLADALFALSEEVLIVEKTSSSGKFLVISQAPSTGQIFNVVVGDPEKISNEVNTILGSFDVDLIIPTFSASHYIVVSK